MTTTLVSADGHAVALACSTLGLGDDRSLKPLTPTEWHDSSRLLVDAGLRPGDLLGRDASSLDAMLPLPEGMAKRLAALMSRGGQLAVELDRLASRGIWVATRADDDYPALIKRRLRQASPPVLFGSGDRSCFEPPGLAVVGSRDVNEEGLAFADALGRQCTKHQVAVISGAARGVDSAAMAGALDAGGTAVGVTVDPLERLVRRRDLRGPIEDGVLVLVTPFHPSTRWHVGNAMRRNRMVYALAQAAVVVTSSADGGGTRTGATENLKSAWVPLYVRDDGSPGNRQLVHDGAALLTEDPAALDVHALFGAGDVRIALNAPALDQSPARTSTPKAQGENLVGSPESDFSNSDLFSRVWPILGGYLTEPRDEREVAERFELELTQARTWLKRAVEEGRAKMKQRPQRYFVAGEQDELFDRGRD